MNKVDISHLRYLAMIAKTQVMRNALSAAANEIEVLRAARNNLNATEVHEIEKHIADLNEAAQQDPPQSRCSK